MELVSKEVNLVSPMRQLGLFFAERQSHFLELLPHFVLYGLGFSFLSLYHNNKVVGVAGISYLAWMSITLCVVGRTPLLPFPLHEFSDECFSCRPLGLFELVSEPCDLIFDRPVFRVPPGV